MHRKTDMISSQKKNKLNRQNDKEYRHHWLSKSLDCIQYIGFDLALNMLNNYCCILSRYFQNFCNSLQRIRKFLPSCLKKNYLLSCKNGTYSSLVHHMLDKSDGRERNHRLKKERNYLHISMLMLDYLIVTFLCYYIRCIGFCLGLST